MASEQHLPYRSTADVVVLDGDGSRWVRERSDRAETEARRGDGLHQSNPRQVLPQLQCGGDLDGCRASGASGR